LHCVYGSRSAELCDAENVLMYNVGVSSFSRTASKAITFERTFDLPPSPVPLGGAAEHYHLYRMNSDGRFLHSTVNAQVGSFVGQVPARVDKVADWWLATRQSIRDGTGSNLTGAHFGLRIRLGATSRSLGGLVKPMLDGIVAAFHWDPAPDPEAVLRLATSLAMTHEALEATVKRSPLPLGPRRLVWPYRQGVQWSPADELCVACDTEISERLPPGRFEATYWTWPLTRPLARVPSTRGVDLHSSRWRSGARY
jgi:hypothetical protein